MASKRTIMIVDDSELVLELAKETLEAAGYRVLTRNRPAGCIAMMLQEQPELVLIDVSMPEIGGDTLVRCFGTAHPSSTTIILLHSSLPAEALAQRAAASGAHGFIHKTKDPSDLVREVRRWLGAPNDSGRFLARTPEKPVRARPLPSEDPISRTRPVGSLRPSRPPRYLEASSGELVTVLLVDTEMLTLSRYRRLLHDEALTFDFALSGEHALRRLGSTSPPDIVVTDVNVGELSGLNIYERMLQADPSWIRRFVFVSGDPGIRIAHFSGTILEKPPSPEALKGAVRGCMRALETARNAASG